MFVLLYLTPIVLAMIYACADVKSMKILKRSAFSLCALIVLLPWFSYLVATVRNTDPSIQFMMWLAVVAFGIMTLLLVLLLAGVVKLTKWLLKKKTAETHQPED